MNKKLLGFFSTMLLITFSFAQQPNFNLTLRSEVSYNVTCASIWGYVDASGNEYALVGTHDGVSIVDVTDPDNPNVLFNVPHTPSEWREIKTYGHYAYATNEDGGGLLIIDLSNLPNSYTQTSFMYTSGNQNTAHGHTLYIDENGRLYIFGGTYKNGGAVMFDLTVDPLNPPYVGEYENHYIHDGFVRGDTLWASEIYDGQVEPVDVSDPANPAPLAAGIHTPSNFSHNSWPTHDDHYLFTTDEVNDSYLTAYDVSDLSNVSEVDRAQSNPGSQVIIHNVHLLNDSTAVVAYYKDGVIIFDVKHPDDMIEVGAYDTDPLESGGNYGGTWGVYPYLPSGNIIASDFTDAGAPGGKLSVITPTYASACWLYGTVTDSTTNALLNGVDVQVLATTNSDITDLSGNYSTGNGVPGVFSVQYSKAGYITKTIPVTLSAGIVTTENVQLVPLITLAYSGEVLDSITGAPLANANVLFESGSNGSFSAITDANGNFTVASIYQGNYDVYAGKWGHVTKGILNTSVNTSSGPIIIKLHTGYYDDFIFDFSWQSSGTAATGLWERGEPIGTGPNPDVDVVGDFGVDCYVTGNGGGSAGTDDVDDGTSILTSPIMDLSNYIAPKIHYYRWFDNEGGNGNPNDTFWVKISNGSQNVYAEKLTANNFPTGQWQPTVFLVNGLIPSSNNMTIQFTTSDQANNPHVVEAALDWFMVTDTTIGEGLQEVYSDIALSSYPNPFSNENVVDFSFSADFHGAQIEIVNELGQIVESYPVKVPDGKLFWGRNLNAGVYFIRIKEGNSVAKVLPAIKSN